jgi:Zn-dependent protease
MSELGTAVPTGGQTPAPPAPRPAGSGWVTGIVSTALLALIIAFQNGWIWALAGVVGVLVHECGHLVVINALGCGPGRLQIIPFLGGAAIMKRPPRTEFQGVLIALAGPVVGLLAAIPFFIAARTTGNAAWAGGAFFIGLINLVNLAPAPPLDGSKALGPALAWIHPWVERAALLMVGAAAALWALNRGSLLFGAFVAIATLASVRRGPQRPDAERLSALQWLASIALWIVAAALCLLVIVACVDTGFEFAPLHYLGFR